MKHSFYRVNQYSDGRVSLPTEADLKSKSPSSFNMPLLKWDQRKRSSTTYAPSIRSGCTMALWHAKSMGVLFGGVTDEDNHEETLDSVFHNDLQVLFFTFLPLHLMNL